MAETLEMKIIGRIRTDLPTKFGIPRQSGVVEDLTGKIVFEPEYRNPDALRGLDVFSHLWLIWQFSKAVREHWSPTVRPPRLGGNTRMGVFATRSPFRPNAIGLSCVKLEQIHLTSPDGPVIIVSGIDLMDGTPILDIKPYIPYADSYPTAKEGFTSSGWERELVVDFPLSLQDKVPLSHRTALMGVLRNDPRPPYQNDPERVYGLPFGRQEIHFKVADGVLTVIDVEDA